MSWDTVFESNGSSGGSADKQEFVKFPEGTTNLRVIGQVPHTRWTHWMPQFKRSANCPGKGCPICAIIKAQKDAGETPRYNTQKKFAIMVINRATERVEILDQGRTFFEDLKDIRDDGTPKSNLRNHGEMENYDIRVRRRGMKQDDTSYRIDFEEAFPMSKKDLELASNAVNLDEYFRPHPIEALNRVLAGEAWDDVMKDVFKKEESSKEEDAPSESEEYSVE